MRSIQVYFEDEEMVKLKNFKNNSTWHDFILKLTEDNNEEKEVIEIEEKEEKIVIRKHLNLNKDPIFIIHEKIKNDIKSIDFNDILPYLKGFFIRKNYFSLKSFFSYLLVYKLGFDVRSEKYGTILINKFNYLTTKLLEQGFIERYNSDSYRILNKNLKKLLENDL